MDFSNVMSGLTACAAAVKEAEDVCSARWRRDCVSAEALSRAREVDRSVSWDCRAALDWLA